MTTLRIKLCLLASAVAMLALPSGASAGYLVPPGNSAATQYTESFPTAGGPADSSHRSGRSGHAYPVRALGARNVRRLAAHGEQGRALAAIAAETAPPSPQRRYAAARGEASQTSPSGHPGSARNDDAATGPRSGGLSGLGEVIGGTIGLSSGQQGPLLPIAIVATIVWLLVYLLRQRRTATP